MSTESVVVEGWPPPKGYANGRIGRGPVLHVATFDLAGPRHAD